MLGSLSWGASSVPNYPLGENFFLISNPSFPYTTSAIPLSAATGHQSRDQCLPLHWPSWRSSKTTITSDFSLLQAEQAKRPQVLLKWLPLQTLHSVCQNTIMSTERGKRNSSHLRKHRRELQSSRGCVPPARPRDGVIARPREGVPASTCRWSDWPRLKGTTAQRSLGLVLTQGLLSGKGIFTLCVPPWETPGHSKPRGSFALPSAERDPAASPPSGQRGARTAQRARAAPSREGVTSLGGRNPASCSRHAASGRANWSLKGAQRLRIVAAPDSGGPGLGRTGVCTIGQTAPPAQGHKPGGAGSGPLKGKKYGGGAAGRQPISSQELPSRPQWEVALPKTLVASQWEARAARSRLGPPPGCARGLPAAGGARGRRRCAGGAEEALPPLSVSLSPSPPSRPSRRPRLPLRSRGLTAGTGGGRDRHIASRCPRGTLRPRKECPAAAGPVAVPPCSGRGEPVPPVPSHAAGPPLPAEAEPRGWRAPPAGGRVSSRPWPLSVPPEPRPGRAPRRSLPGCQSRTKAAGGRERWGRTTRG